MSSSLSLNLRMHRSDTPDWLYPADRLSSLMGPARPLCPSHWRIQYSSVSHIHSVKLNCWVRATAEIPRFRLRDLKMFQRSSPRWWTRIQETCDSERKSRLVPRWVSAETLSWALTGIRAPVRKWLIATSPLKPLTDCWCSVWVQMQILFLLLIC